jgi:solute carrier family 50 protein (sugar transporter)
MSITDILGSLGNAFAIIFFIIPITVIIQLIRTKDTDRVPFLLFIFTILNCEFWVLYGAKSDQWPLILCNAVGIVTNSFFLTVYFRYLKIELYKKALLICMLYIGFVSSFTLLYLLVKGAQIFGIIAMIMNICMFASPLQNLKKVISQKDNSYIPLPVSIALIFNCVVWALYGFFKDKDLYVIIPNILGFGLAISQVILWIVYRKYSKSYAKNSEEDELQNKQEDNIIKTL